MARGWESKSVESQMEDGPRRGGDHSAESRAERELSQKRDSLELSRRNVSRDLETARTETHRSALRNALAFIESEIARLDR